MKEIPQTLDELIDKKLEKQKVQLGSNMALLEKKN